MQETSKRFKALSVASRFQTHPEPRTSSHEYGNSSAPTEHPPELRRSFRLLLGSEPRQQKPPKKKKGRALPQNSDARLSSLVHLLPCLWHNPSAGSAFELDVVQ